MVIGIQIVAQLIFALICMVVLYFAFTIFVLSSINGISKYKDNLVISYYHIRTTLFNKQFKNALQKQYNSSIKNSIVKRIQKYKNRNEDFAYEYNVKYSNAYECRSYIIAQTIAYTNIETQKDLHQLMRDTNTEIFADRLAYDTALIKQIENAHTLSYSQYIDSLVDLIIDVHTTRLITDMCTEYMEVNDV